jgi:hypothetical protein
MTPDPTSQYLYRCRQVQRLIYPTDEIRKFREMDFSLQI